MQPSQTTAFGHVKAVAVLPEKLAVALQTVFTKGWQVKKTTYMVAMAGPWTDIYIDMQIGMKCIVMGAKGVAHYTN